MRVTDLQLDDLVYYKGLTIKNYACKVYSIEGRYPRKDKEFNDQYIIDLWVGDGFLSVHIEDLTPIPLTAKIFKNNGFRYEKYYKGYAYTKNPFVVIYDLKEGIMYIRGERNNMINVKLANVHECQHALRLCGLKELANNFKV